jgi:hypothetical protein
MRNVYIIIRGLMEHEGRTFVEKWGCGVGDTLYEVCQDIIRKDPKKGQYFHTSGPERCDDWGFKLTFLPELD